jgi:hypothetical protein
MDIEWNVHTVTDNALLLNKCLLNIRNVKHVAILRFISGYEWVLHCSVYFLRQFVYYSFFLNTTIESETAEVLAFTDTI